MLPVNPDSISPQFGDNKISTETRAGWDDARARRDKAIRYYSGAVFDERVVTDDANEDAPLMYPVALNLVKMIVLGLTDATYGEWEDQIVMFEGRKSSRGDGGIQAASEFMSAVMNKSNSQSSFWELDFSRNLYGAGVLKVSPSLNAWPFVKWTVFPIDGFYPIFNPEDPDILIECYAMSLLTAEQVRQVYGIDPDTLQTVPVPGGIPGAYYVKTEHWTNSVYETYLNGMSIPAYSGINPWGVVPFIYIPRMRTIDWNGESAVDDLYATQDELNTRVADIGDELAYNSHPIRWGRNMPVSFDAKNFPLGANAFWNLGREFGNGTSAPEVGILQTDNPVPTAAFSHVNFIYDWARVSSFAPPVAFGEDDGGGQRSGVTLEIRLWPMLKALRRSRSYLATGLQRALFVTGKILAQRGYTGVDASISSTLMDGKVIPVFHRVLPRDQVAAVDEVVKLMSTEPPSVSMETAQTILGRGVGELERIQETIALKQKLAAAAAKVEAEASANKGGENTKGSLKKEPKDREASQAAKEQAR